MTRMDRVVEIDRTSRAARIQAGALGPVLEDQLRPHGLTLRHYPQSFEFSTLGGWLATRAGGHFATVYTHIDDLCESMRVVTPVGAAESRRLPGSGAGPSPDRLFLGSEGTLGVITEAWMRLQDRPRWKTSAGRRVPRPGHSGAEAVRALAQSGLFPGELPAARRRRGPAVRPALPRRRRPPRPRASSRPTTRWTSPWTGRSSCAATTGAHSRAVVSTDSGAPGAADRATDAGGAVRRRA